MREKSTQASQAIKKPSAAKLGLGFDRSVLQKDIATLFEATEGKNIVNSDDNREVIKSLQRTLNAINQPQKPNENWQAPKLPISGKIADFTQNNIKAFQQSRKDVPDSGQCDRKTVEGFAAALKLKPSTPPLPTPNASASARQDSSSSAEIKPCASFKEKDLPIPIDRVSKTFPHAQTSDIKQYYPLICKELKNLGIEDPCVIKAAIANLRAETCTFQPITERPSRLSDKDGKPQYDYSNYQNRLGNRPNTNDAARFCGRGFIQLTGRSNYIEYGKKIGVNLVSNPELANKPEIAAKIFAAYIADKREILESGDLAKIRSAINGGSNGKVAFEKAFRTLSDNN